LHEQKADDLGHRWMFRGRKSHGKSHGRSRAVLSLSIPSRRGQDTAKVIACRILCRLLLFRAALI